jgi:PTH1 family peptidyl-tRNA hydrolase
VKKFLIAGLGNIGSEYENTRHNIGFKILDALVESASNIRFKEDRYVSVAEYKYKGRIYVLIKPNTYMNLSGKAVNYWLQKENIPVSNLLVVTDDIALEFGTIRIKGKGSDGGHNGLKDIIATLGDSAFARFRFGVGNDFGRGQQADYVLGEWTEEDKTHMNERLEKSIQAIQSFGFAGLAHTMSNFNNK